MQSFIQYRRFGRNIREQLDRHSLKRNSPQNAAAQAEQAPAQGFSANLPDYGYVAAEEKESEDSSAPTDVEPQTERRSSTTNGESVERDHLRPPSSEFAPITAEKKAETDDLNAHPTLSRASTKSNKDLGVELGTTLTGIHARNRDTNDGGEKNEKVFIVGFNGDDDMMNPQNWSTWTRTIATLRVASIGAIVGFASSIDASALLQASKEFGVSEVVESLATGLYLAGFGTGALFAGPLSETLGRNPIYIATLTLYMAFIMASGLAPNIGAQLAFRFLAGFFGSTPLTCAGGSIADMWSPLERVFAFPVFANAAFMGPVLGPVVGGFIAESSLVSWRWTEWITLIISGLVLFGVVCFQPETYPDTLLQWKASHLRRLTGDDRYRAPLEVRQDSFLLRLRRALSRPFILTIQEPIIILVSLYLTIIYIVLFTFLDGYEYIFGEIHGTSQGITGLCFLGIAIGLCGASALVPLIYKWAKRDLKIIKEKGGDRLPPEFRLWYSMFGGSFALPISLFWMGWTSYSWISIWSPLAASVLFGYGILCVFISSYQYIIDSYERFAASALASVTVIRYVVSGGMVVVGIPFYENLGVQYTLTILACISAVMAPVPFVFYKYGPQIRKRSKYAPTSDL